METTNNTTQTKTAGKVEFNNFSPFQSEQYVFLMLPIALMKDKVFSTLSDSAKILYSLLLNRLSLSRKNNWVDEDGDVFIIYSVSEIEQDLGCSHPTAIKLLKELDVKTGIGLIERKRRGLGMPDIIYVKNFADYHVSKM